MGTSKLGGEGGGEPSLENNPLTVRDVSNGNPALRREREVEAEAAKVTLYPISSRPTPFCSSLALSVSQPAAFVLRSFLSSFGI